MTVTFGVVLGWGLLGCPHTGAPAVFETRVVDAEVRGVLEAAASSLDPLERREALPVLIRLEAAPAGGTWGARGRYDPSYFVRRAVIPALGHRAEAEADTLLEGLARETSLEPYTRGLAALELSFRDAARWRAPLAELAAATAADPELLLLAAAHAGDAAALARLGERLATGELPMDLSLPRALIRCRLPLQSSLAAAVEAVEPPMAPSLAAAWWVADPVAARPWFVAALADPDEDLSIEAAEWLVELGAASPGPAASPVARALLDLADADTAEAIRAAESPDGDIRLAATRALGRLVQAEGRGGAARRSLEDLASSGALPVRLAAIHQLGRVGGSEAVLRTLLRDEQPRLQVAAAVAWVGR